MPGPVQPLRILLILARPRDALAAARQGLPVAEDDPDDMAVLHSLVAQAALETGGPVAAQACADFHRLLEDKIVTMSSRCSPGRLPKMSQTPSIASGRWRRSCLRSSQTG